MADVEYFLGVGFSENFVLIGTNKPFEWISEKHCFGPGWIIQQLICARDVKVSKQESMPIGFKMWQRHVVSCTEGEAEEFYPFRNTDLQASSNVSSRNVAADGFRVHIMLLVATLRTFGIPQKISFASGKKSK
jgi:hypothetical protein